MADAHKVFYRVRFLLQCVCVCVCVCVCGADCDLQSCGNSGFDHHPYRDLTGHIRE